MALAGDHSIIEGNLGASRIVDVQTGISLKGLNGHNESIQGIHIHDGVIASCDYDNLVIIWNMKAGLQGEPFKTDSFEDPDFGYGSFDMKVGRSFVVISNMDIDSRAVIKVVDFPS